MYKRLEADKYLVVEQKGWRVVILGLSLSLIFGLTFKAVFSPRRIQYEIERVLSATDPRIAVNAEGAHLSLSDGIWPRLAIVINKLGIHTKDPCIRQIKAQIENLEMPIAFLSLLDRNLIFKSIKVGVLDLEMKATVVECAAGSAIPSTPATLSQEVSKPSEVVDSRSSQETTMVAAPPGFDKLKRPLESPPLVQTMSMESKLLKHLFFREIRLRLVEWPQFQWNLKEINVSLPSNDQEKALVKGVISLASPLLPTDPTRPSFQGLNAKVEAQVNSQSIEAKVHGAWREGRIDLQGFFEPQTQNLNLSGTFKQIPWAQLVVLAQAFGKSGALPVSSQAWVSTRLEWTRSLEAAEHIAFSDTRIEGEFGDFLLGKVVLDQQPSDKKEDWTMSPFRASMKDINIDVLAKILGWERRYSTFHSFGIFNGELQYREPQSLELRGELKDLKVIFAGKGRSQLQNINSLKLEMKGNEKEWSGSLNDINLDGGHWNGGVAMIVNQTTKTVHLDSQFSQLKLSADVEKMMTVNGNLKPIDGRLDVDFVDGQMVNLKGYLKSDQMNINNFSLDKVRVDFDGNKGQINGKVYVQDLVAPRAHLEYWPHPLPGEYESLKVKNLVGNFSQNSIGISVKDLQGYMVDFKTRFLFDATADVKEQIQGKLQIRGDRNKIQTYQLLGTRKTPQWAH